MKKRLPFFLLLIFGFLLAVPQAAHSQNDTREVGVVVLIDENDYGKPSVDSAIDEALEFASMELERSFRIRLRFIGVGKWNFPAGKNKLETETAYPDVEQISKEITVADIVIAYTTKSISRLVAVDMDGFSTTIREEYDGVAIPYEPGDGVYSHAAIVRIGDNTNIATLHEIYHLFGAQDIRGGTENSIMRLPTTTILDEKNFDVIMANRMRSFTK